MRINITQITPTIKSTNNSDKILAYASIRLENEEGKPLITINGFTIRKSKFETEPCVIFPSKSMGMGKGFYKYTLIENSIKKEVEEEIIKAFKSDIPIIEENNY
jgi:hypothetical protein